MTPEVYSDMKLSQLQPIFPRCLHNRWKGGHTPKWLYSRIHTPSFHKQWQFYHTTLQNFYPLRIVVTHHFSDVEERRNKKQQTSVPKHPYSQKEVNIDSSKAKFYNISVNNTFNINSVLVLTFGRHFFPSRREHVHHTHQVWAKCISTYGILMTSRNLAVRL
jgi:hypothetical protein